MKREYPGIDLLKFVFSLMIVAMHANILNPEIQFQYKLQLTVFALAVPFFFMSTGYFCFLCEGGANTEYNRISKTLKHFIKLYVIFGGWYFTISLVKVLSSRNANIFSLLDLLHHVLVESPGGAQWYTYSCIWILLLLKFCNRKINNSVILVFYLIAYLFGSLLMLDVAKDSFLRNLYDMIFISDRNILFFGIYFMIGAECAQKGEIRHSNSSIWKYVFGLVVYLIYGMLLYTRDFVLSTVIFSILKLIATYSLFRLAQNINHISVDCHFLRKLSTVIFFTHYTLVMIFVRIAVILNARVLMAVLCVICSVLLGIAIVQIKNGRLYKTLFT